MRKVTTRHAFLALGALLAVPLLHCDGGDVDVDPSAQSSPDGGANGDDGGPCVPKTCADTERCGTYDDGCGGTLRCDEACTCTPDDFEVTCPPRPCEVVAGCVDQLCQYAPVRCGAPGAEEACAPVACEGEGCGNVATSGGDSEKLYACGGNVCKETAFYCDPSAAIEGGKIVYQNRCVPPPSVGCGTCGLGASSCDSATDRFVCDALSVPVLEGGGTVECDSTVAGSTFVFVDAQYTGGGSDGSRKRPYTSYAAALSAAQARNARGIVIAGSPVFSEALVVKSGISVYGGFDGAPDFTPNRAQRPRWSIPATAASGNLLLGATARDIVDATVLYHIDIETPDAVGQHDGQGISNIALWVQDSTALRLEEVRVHAGAGTRGTDGTDGATGANGGNAVGVVPGPAGSGCSTTCTVTAPIPPTVNGSACGAGGQSDREQGIFNGVKPGNANGESGDRRRLGGAAGRTCGGNGCHSCSPGEEQTDGSDGRTGVEGDPGKDGPGGDRPLPSVHGVSMVARMDGSNGGRGSWGSGGGAGGAYRDSCMNGANWGGNGGGAGGPGCGGEGGTGGGAGGLSAAIVLVGSSQNLVLRSSTVTGSKGGDGGKGGEGGPGGDGGLGAAGGSGEGFGSDRAGDGGKGGDGGRGGRGGHGGGGAAGSSFGIWCETTSMNVTRDSATTVSAGAAGAVGTSPGNDGAVGESAPIANCTTP